MRYPQLGSAVVKLFSLVTRAVKVIVVSVEESGDESALALGVATMVCFHCAYCL